MHKQTSYYDRNYGENTRRNYLRRLRRSLVTEYIDVTKEYDYVLDIGCGPAILYPDLVNTCSKYFAVDLVRTNLEQIEQDSQKANIECILADLDILTWQEDFFDIIICSGAIEYTHKPENNLLKLIGFLKKDGILICSFPNGASPYCLWNQYVYRYVSYTKNKLLSANIFLYPRKLFSVKKVKALIQGHGLDSIGVVYFGYKLIPEPLNYVLENLDYKITRYFQDNPGKWLRKCATEFLVLVRR